MFCMVNLLLCHPWRGWLFMIAPCVLQSHVQLQRMQRRENQMSPRALQSPRPPFLISTLVYRHRCGYRWKSRIFRKFCGKKSWLVSCYAILGSGWLVDAFCDSLIRAVYAVIGHVINDTVNKFLIADSVALLVVAARVTNPFNSRHCNNDLVFVHVGNKGACVYAWVNVALDFI